MLLDLPFCCPRRPTTLLPTFPSLLPALELQLVINKEAAHLHCPLVPQQTVSRPGQLGSQLLSPAAHLGLQEVTGGNKPCSKAKLAETTTHPPPPKPQPQFP